MGLLVDGDRPSKESLPGVMLSDGHVDIESLFRLAVTRKDFGELVLRTHIGRVFIAQRSVSIDRFF